MAPTAASPLSHAKMASMSGDLEDFLRRAAQRRQAKTAQQQQAAQPTPRRAQPRYSDSRTERLVQPVNGLRDEIDEVLTAEIVEEDDFYSQQVRQRDAQRRKIKEAQQVARQLKSKIKKKPTTIPTSPPSTGDANADLFASLRQPGGLKQAILLREIMDRPVHRW